MWHTAFREFSSYFVHSQVVGELVVDIDGLLCELSKPFLWESIDCADVVQSVCHLNNDNANIATHDIEKLAQSLDLLIEGFFLLEIAFASLASFSQLPGAVSVPDIVSNNPLSNSRNSFPKLLNLSIIL